MKKINKIVILVIILLCICIYKDVLAINSEEDGEIHVSQIKLNRSVLYMIPENVNESESYYKRKLVATLTPSNASNNEIIWTSSNTTVATVDSDGVVIAKSPGNCLITVKTQDGEKIATCTVNVESNVLSNIYEINPIEICSVLRDTSNDIRAMQGVYFYKSNNTEYALYAGYQADDKPTVMTLVNLNTGSVISKNNSKCMIHANDITYAEGKYYVTLDNSVYGMTIKNNQEIIIDDEPIEMNFAVSGFEYDKENNKYYTRKGEYLYTVPSLESDKKDLKVIGIFPNYYSNIEEGNTKMVNQGLYYANNNIYIPRTISNTSSSYYNHTYICVYDATTGKYKYTMHFSNILEDLNGGDLEVGHLEGITIIGNTMYFGINFHKTPRQQQFLKFEGIDEIEQNYQLTIDKEKPTLDISYSTTKATNKDVIVTINSNEEIKSVSGWTLSEDKKTLTKTYTENKSENIEITDLAGNISTATIEIKNIDKEKPIVEVKYSTKEQTLNDVIVTIEANEELQEVEGWQLSDDKKTLTKTYTKNGEETITIKDLAGNNIEETIKVENIDKEKPEHEVKYSTTLSTNEDVTVTITANEEIKSIEGWTLSEDKKVLTKTYTENTEETITIKDVAGNSASETTIKINNIDKIKPEINISYSITEITNQDIIVTIIANKEIKEIEGWNLSTDKKELKKKFTSNTEENITISDLAGNTISDTIKISNVDKVAPKIEIKYSTTSATDKDVIVTITSDKIIRNIDGWTLSSDKKQLTKTFTENGEEEITITDEAGNSVTTNIKVSNIDKTEVNQVDTKATSNNDTTTEKMILPNTGEKNVLIFVAIFMIISLIMYIKLKKYKDVK